MNDNGSIKFADLVDEICAGCNTFDYLIEGARVTAVDLNAAQIALTDLKAAAIRTLDFKDFFSIFAKNDVALLRSKYQTELRPLLLDRSQLFWDEKVNRQSNSKCCAM
jgi:S-adenosylmethionine:diacylglycerol 3-amino-3-carboxypropyl transferase